METVGFNDFLTKPIVKLNTDKDTNASNNSLGGHSVSIVGWGEQIQDGELIKYWLCRNSWGVGWGDKGYFKIGRGYGIGIEANNLGLWAEIFNKDDIASSVIVNFTVNDVDKAERAFNDVDPVSFYQGSSLDDIKKNKVKGTIKEIINDNLVPVSDNFWAYLIGTESFQTYGGENIISAKKGRIFNNFILLLCILFIIFILYKIHNRK